MQYSVVNFSGPFANRSDAWTGPCLHHVHRDSKKWFCLKYACRKLKGFETSVYFMKISSPFLIPRNARSVYDGWLKVAATFGSQE